MEASASYNPLEYHRSRSNSPIFSENAYDLSYLDLDTDSLRIEIQNDQKNRHDKIRSLILSNNLLTDLPENLRIFSKLITLEISSNQIKNLSIDLCQVLPNLRNLICKNNQLSDGSLPKCFGSNSNLEVINLSGNQFTQFPYQLLEIMNVREIYLGSNQIGVLPRNYENLFNLEILYLGGNFIKKIPDELSQLKNLTSLNLSDNQLTILPAKLAHLKRLRTLALHGNNLTTLPVELVKLNLSELSLRNNPLVHRFAKEFIYEVPSLLELSARCVKIKQMKIQTGYLPQHLEKYLNSATCCLNPKCSGVYFTSKVEHVKFVDFCGRYRIPLMQYLCSSSCNEKIQAKKIQKDMNLISSSDSSSDSDDENSNEKILKKILLG